MRLDHLFYGRVVPGITTMVSFTTGLFIGVSLGNSDLIPNQIIFFYRVEFLPASGILFLSDFENFFEFLVWSYDQWRSVQLSISQHHHWVSCKLASSRPAIRPENTLPKSCINLTHHLQTGADLAESRTVAVTTLSATTFSR